MEQGQTDQMIRPWLLIVLVVVILAGGGYFGWNYWNKSKTAGPIIKPILSDDNGFNHPASPDTTLSTADWKTYMNDQYGFSFKYPSEWKIYTRENDTNYKSLLIINANSASAIGPSGISVSIFQSYKELDSSNKTVTSLKDYLDKYSIMPNQAYSTVSSISIFGKNGYKATWKTGEDYSYYFSLDNGNILEFHNLGLDDTIKEIETTFQFAK